jgi:hypothetical protein
VGSRGARARGQEGRGTAAGKARGDTWARAEAGGGARGAASAVSGSGRSRAEGKRWCQRKTKQGGVRGTCLQFPKISGTFL